MSDPTSTAFPVFDAFVADLTAAMTGPNAGVRVFEAWPGPEGQSEMVVLGGIEWEGYELASIKSGRQHRTEVYDIGFDVYVMGANGSTPADPRPTRIRATEIFAAVEDLFAEEPTTPTGPAVAWLNVRPTEAGPRVFPEIKGGWAWRVAGTIHATARLT